MPVNLVQITSHQGQLFAIDDNGRLWSLIGNNIDNMRWIAVPGPCAS